MNDLPFFDIVVPAHSYYLIYSMNARIYIVGYKSLINVNVKVANGCAF